MILAGEGDVCHRSGQITSSNVTDPILRAEASWPLSFETPVLFGDKFGKWCGEHVAARKNYGQTQLSLGSEYPALGLWIRLPADSSHLVSDRCCYYACGPFGG